jgi:hypothetical protein
VERGLTRASKVPPSVLQRAEKEAPGARFATTYKDNEKGYRLVGKRPDGSWISLRIDREGALERVRTWTEVPSSKIPKAISAALQSEIRKPPVPRSGKDLGGFTTVRVWLVDEFIVRIGKSETFYEFLGKTAQNPFFTVQIAKSGEVVGAKSASLSPSSAQRQSFSQATVVAVMKAKLDRLVPGIKLNRVVRVTTNNTFGGFGVPNVSYRMYGRNRADRAVEADVMGLSEITNLAEEIPFADIPRAVVTAVQKLVDADKDLKGFRPVDARRVRRLGRGGVADYLVYGDNVYGDPVVIEVDDQLKANCTPDRREDWEVAPSTVVAGQGIPPTGFAVLAAKYGNGGWIDVTDFVRNPVPAGVLKIGIGGSLPDPAYGLSKGIVVAYAINGKVGLMTAGDGTDVNLPLRNGA